MECVFQTLIDLDDIFNEKENKVRLFGSENVALSNNDKGLADSGSEGKPDPLPLSGGTSTNKQQQKPKNVVNREDLPWDLLKKLNSCLPLTARFKICEDTVRDTVIIYYKNLLERLLNSVERVSFDETWKRQVLEGIFINGCHDQAILILCKTLQIQAQKSFKQDVVISILEKFFSGESLSELMFHQCYFKSSLTHHQFSINSNIPNPHWELLLSYLVHLPDKMTNKMRGKPRYPFDKASYVALFCQALVEALSQLSVELSRGKKINLDFLSQFLGRMCLSGNGEEIFKNITPIILSECHDNLEWRRVTKYLIVNVPDRCLENVLKPLLSNIPWYGYVKYFLGEILRKHGTIYFIVTKKFILINHFEDPIVLQNCIGYLANDAMAENKSNIFLEVVHFILESWSESTSMKYLSYEQHYNWTCALAMLSPYLKGRNFEAYKRPFLSLLMAGVQLRIKNPSYRIRVHGMFIGELLTAILEPDMPQLQFEYEKTPEILKLIGYSQAPQEPPRGQASPPPAIAACANGNGEEKAVFQSPADIVASLVTSPLSNQDQEPIDSDDDLEAFDLKEEGEELGGSDNRSPYYIRDCLKGLIEQSDAAWSATCLDCAEKLVKNQPNETKEIAVEFCKVLLSLENQSFHETFVSSRFRALVALLRNSPQEVAQYLGRQFYDRNYSLRQRFDILEVLAAASQELSGVKNVSSRPPSEPPEPKLIHDLKEATQASSPTWQEIVRRRLEAKTKIILTKGKSVPPVAIENQFSNVAGCFFFPLISNYDNKENSFDLLGEDSYLLGRLVYTLGILINSASNSVVVRKLAKVLLEFLWVFRYHVEVFVRQSLLFALSMIIMNVQASILFTEMQTEIFEFQSWLQDIVSHDTDYECRKIASQVLALLAKTYTEEFSVALTDSQNQ